LEKADKIWMDGEIVDWGDAHVHLVSNTLQYGFGVFEGIRCYQTTAGRSAIFRLSEHNRRLFDSAKILGLKIPFSEQEIEKACIETVRVNKLRECYVRPIVFVGDGEMGVPSALTNDVLESPDAAHWLGTTLTGQDIFSQLIEGTRVSILWGFATGLVVTALSLIVGLTAGYLGGIVDDALTLLINIFLVLPGFPLAVVLAAYPGALLATVHAVVDEENARLVAFAALDNLVKGAAGSALQNFNARFGYPETMGLEALPLWP